MTEYIKNYQMKNHFAHHQKHMSKNIKRSTENNLSRPL